jgi:thermitase
MKERADLFVLLLLLISLPILTMEVGRQKLISSDAEEASYVDTEEPPKPDQIIVKFKDGVGENKKEKFFKDKGLEGETENFKFAKITTIKVPTNQIEKVIDVLEEDPNVEYAEPDYYAKPSFVPNDPKYKNQWWLHKIKAEKAWDITKGSPSVNVAILDNGVDVTHPDLSSKIVKRKNNQNDEIGHGTHVAGIAAAATNNGMGVASIGNKVNLYVADVGTNIGVNLSKATDALYWAADNGADVVNMSYTSFEKTQTEEKAINYAYNKGLVLVSCAGNFGRKTKMYPAAFNNVIAVAATDSKDYKTDFSHYGTWVDIAAPGLEILSTDKGGGYITHFGTSMASPIVAGVAALIKSAYPNYSNSQIRDRLCLTADDIGKEGKFWICGRVNAYKAVQGGTGTNPTQNPYPTYSPIPTTPPGPAPTAQPISSQNYQIKVNFQGVTETGASQVIEYKVYNASSLVSSGTSVSSNDSNGIYSIQIPKSDVSVGTYTLYLKGESHLQKKFVAVDFSGTEIDLTGSENNVARAGDVTGDNLLNISDISRVSRYYTDFSIPVDYGNQQMAASDVNKDGSITIQDLALLGINWSELEVPGDN